MQTASPCRHCDSTGHHVSHLRPFDWPFYALGFVPIRCKNCGHRSYRHKILLNRKHEEGQAGAKLD